MDAVAGLDQIVVETPSPTAGRQAQSPFIRCLATEELRLPHRPQVGKHGRVRYSPRRSTMLRLPHRPQVGKHKAGRRHSHGKTTLRLPHRPQVGKHSWGVVEPLIEVQLRLPHRPQVGKHIEVEDLDWLEDVETPSPTAGRQARQLPKLRRHQNRVETPSPTAGRQAQLAEFDRLFGSKLRLPHRPQVGKHREPAHRLRSGDHVETPSPTAGRQAPAGRKRKLRRWPS